MGVDVERVMQLCIMAGAAMLQNGAETSRVEDTIRRIAASFNVQYIHSFVTPTGIFITLEDKTQLIRISERFINLNKVSQINQLSRSLADKDITLDEAISYVQEIRIQKPPYPSWLVILAAGAAGGSFAYLFGGEWVDVFPGIIVGGLVQTVLTVFQNQPHAKFLAEFLAALVGGAFSVAAVSIGLGEHLAPIIIGSLMPLVPGVAITNAVRDMLAGELVSGLARGAEAAITALSVAAGMATILSIVG
jgi:uncharacterized membrane protein YjjP (DUF1212 family)